MKKKTHEEYVEELKIKNPNVCVIGKYVNSTTKIEHKCLIHNISWMNTPSRMLLGVGCEKCHAERIFKSKTRTHEEYVEQLKRVNQNIVPLEKFVTCTTPILHYCKKHDIQWRAIPDNILHGHGCCECGKEKIGIKNAKSYEQYQKELHSKFPDIECIGEYVNSTTPVLHECKKCGYEWMSQPIYVLNNVGCQRCLKHLRRNTQEYIEDLQKINPQLELVGEYSNANTHALHRCKIHNYTWNVVPSSLLNGTGCPICGREKLSLLHRKTHEEYENELYHVNQNVRCIGRYIDSTTKIKVQCLKCNTVWKCFPSNLLRGHGCPSCNFSRGEDEIQDWLIAHDINFVPQKRFKDCKDKRALPFDFYIPTRNVAIEYDGDQHYKAIDWFGGEKGLDYRKKHDKIKTEYCMKNNIELLRITTKDNIQAKLNSFFI